MFRGMIILPQERTDMIWHTIHTHPDPPRVWTGANVHNVYICTGMRDTLHTGKYDAGTNRLNIFRS